MKVAKMKVEQLRKVAKAKGLDATGTKDVLVERITEQIGEDVEVEPESKGAALDVDPRQYRGIVSAKDQGFPKGEVIVDGKFEMPGGLKNSGVKEFEAEGHFMLRLKVVTAKKTYWHSLPVGSFNSAAQAVGISNDDLWTEKDGLFLLNPCVMSKESGSYKYDIELV